MRAADATNGAQPSAVAGTAARKARCARSHASRFVRNSSSAARGGGGRPQGAATGAGAAWCRAATGAGAAARIRWRGLARQADSCAARGEGPSLFGTAWSRLSHH